VTRSEVWGEAGLVLMKRCVFAREVVPPGFLLSCVGCLLSCVGFLLSWVEQPALSPEEHPGKRACSKDAIENTCDGERESE